VVECYNAGVKQSLVYGQHQDWATLGFIRAVASNKTICQCLMMDKRWPQTLLNIVNDADTTAAAAVSTVFADDENNDNGHTDVHRCSLPKRVS